jgi:hypothetical protein
MPLCEVQGRRFAGQQGKWELPKQGYSSLAPEQAQTFLDAECQTPEQGYRPSHINTRTMSADIEVFEAIRERCSEVGV